MMATLPKQLRSQRTDTSISVAEAKAKFSSLLSEVEKKHKPVTILRRGIPVAQIVPFPAQAAQKFKGSMAGTVKVLGDIVNPYLEEWTVSGE